MESENKERSVVGENEERSIVEELDKTISKLIAAYKDRCSIYEDRCSIYEEIVEDRDKRIELLETNNKLLERNNTLLVAAIFQIYKDCNTMKSVKQYCKSLLESSGCGSLV